MGSEQMRVTENEENPSKIPSEERRAERSGIEAVVSICVPALMFLMVGAHRLSHGGIESRKRSVPSIPTRILTVSKAIPGIGSLTGEPKQVTVQPGETLLQIARQHNTDTVSLLRLNRLKSATLSAGQSLRLPTMHVVPFAPREGIVLNIPERGVYLFHNGHLKARYPVAVGARTWETPVGTFKLVRKVINPAWVPPKVMVQREGIPSFRVPPGKTNPLGDRWMGWSAPEVGFHSTPLVETVGQYASHACVRLYPESAHALFDRVSLGTPIYALYEPILIGKQEHDYYLSVSPDIYGKKPVSLANVRKRVEKAGLGSLVNWSRIEAIARGQDGYPYRITRHETPEPQTHETAREKGRPSPAF